MTRLIIVQDRATGFQACDLGIVLNDGETAWQRPGRLSVPGRGELDGAAQQLLELPQHH